MLDVREVFGSGDTAIRDVHCAHPRGSCSDAEAADRPALVLILRGGFRRRAQRRWETLDPGYAFFQHPSEEQSFMHPLDRGDRCLSIGLSDDAAASDFPTRAFPAPVSARRFAHMLAITAGQDHADAEDGVAALVGRSLRVARRQRAHAPSRERVASAARAELAAEPRVTLATLAFRLNCSADHIGRAVAESTGRSFSAYRSQLRVKAAMERIGSGEADLARLAADTGFADHSHMTRSLQAELGIPPTQLRRMLTSGGGE